MRYLFDDEAWEQYLYWLSQDKKTLNRINTLIKDIERNGHDGIGNPEPLKHNMAGYWSRRINNKDRLIYKIEGDIIKIHRCGTHYGDH
jgi:toxin YoeB